MIEDQIAFAFLLISLLFFERWTLELFFPVNVLWIIPSELYKKICFSSTNSPA